MKSSVLSVAAFVVLASCTGLGPAPVPVISSFNEASVGIQLDGFAMDLATQETKDAAIAAANDQAEGVCRRGPNRRAEFASTRNIPTGQYAYVIERLYLCLR